MCVVEEVQAEVEQTCRYSLAVYREMFFDHMPSSRTSNQCRQFPVCSELVLFLSLLEINLFSNCVVQIDLAVNHVIPCWCTRIWKISVLEDALSRNALPSKSAM